MFRKVQLKFFGIITSILLVVFIGLLFSVNLIMNALLERQTKVVLQQVAEGVEYNSKTETFTYINPQRPNGDMGKNPPPDEIQPSEEPPSETEVQPTEAPSTEPKEPETAPEETEPAEEEPNEEEPAEEEPNEEEPAPEEPPAEEQPPEPNEPAPEEPPQDPTQQEWDPSWGWDPNWGWNPWWGWYPWWGWGDPNAGGGDPNNGGGDPNAGGNPWVAPQYNIQSSAPSENRDDLNDKPKDDKNRGEGDDGYEGEKQEKHVGIGVMPQYYGYSLIAKADTPRPPEPHTVLDHDKFGEPVPRSMGSIDFFVIMADKQGNFVASLNRDDLTETIAQDYIDSIRIKGEASGMTGNLSYCAAPKSNGTLMVLTDRTAEINMMNKLKRTTAMVGVISIIFLSGAAYFVSGIIVHPLKETFEKQKQFISDASHELKTPLTVISTNADVLAGEVGDNKWLNYIQDQAERMNVLVNDLLNLTRLENSSREFITHEFLLSRAVMNAALPFECQAFESRKNFVLNIDEGISVVGSEQHIKQMTAIFIDNAIKYSKEGGTVRVSLSKEDGKPVLAVYNTGQGVKDSEKDKLFERFYRSDESRNRSTGGYGLGLAIAKSIIDKHKFKVVVENEEGKSICFKVIM